MDKSQRHISPLIPAALVLIIIVGTYLIIQNQKKVREFTTPPSLTEQLTQTPAPDSGTDTQTSPVPEITQVTLSVISPQNGATVTAPSVTVRGKTLPRAEVFANEAEGIADASGSFSLTVSLDEGENSIIVTVVDENGNVSEKELFITYDAG